MNWGLVAGKTQTYLPWEFQTKAICAYSAHLWFHEYSQDGTPYRQHEVDLIRQLTERGTPEKSVLSAP